MFSNNSPLLSLIIATAMFFLGGHLFTYTVSSILFGSVLIHEIGHYVIAKMCPGIKVIGLRFSLLGGRVLWHPSHRAIENVLAIFGGPTFSLIACLLSIAWVNTVGSAASYISLFFNAGLVAMNVTPLFPMDGGRIAGELVESGVSDEHKQLVWRVVTVMGALYLLLAYWAAVMPFWLAFIMLALLFRKSIRVFDGEPVEPEQDEEPYVPLTPMQLTISTLSFVALMIIGIWLFSFIPNGFESIKAIILVFLR